MRVKRSAPDPDKPESIVEQIDEVIRSVEFIEFGEPLDPNDSQSTTLPGGTGAGAHNGTPSNIAGSWVELNLESATSTQTCNHNLYLQDGAYVLPVASPGSPNCRWLVFGWQYDNFTITPPVALSVYYNGGTILANSIDLAFDITGTITVNASHPVKVTLFFVRGSR